MLPCRAARWRALGRLDAAQVRAALLRALPLPPAALRRCPAHGAALRRALLPLTEGAVLAALLRAGTGDALAALAALPPWWRPRAPGRAAALAGAVLLDPDPRVVVAIGPGWCAGPHTVGRTLGQALAAGYDRRAQLRRVARGDLMVRPAIPSAARE